MHRGDCLNARQRPSSRLKRVARVAESHSALLQLISTPFNPIGPPFLLKSTSNCSLILLPLPPHPPPNPVHSTSSLFCASSLVSLACTLDQKKRTCCCSSHSRLSRRTQTNKHRRASRCCSFSDPLDIRFLQQPVVCHHDAQPRHASRKSQELPSSRPLMLRQARSSTS